MSKYKEKEEKKKEGKRKVTTEATKEPEERGSKRKKEEVRKRREEVDTSNHITNILGRLIITKSTHNCLSTPLMLFSCTSPSPG